MGRRNNRAQYQGYGSSPKQKGKGRKRGGHWHKSINSADTRNWRDHGSQLPDLGTGADPTQAAPQKIGNHGRRGRNRGDAI